MHTIYEPQKYTYTHACNTDLELPLPVGIDDGGLRHGISIYLLFQYFISIFRNFMRSPRNLTDSDNVIPRNLTPEVLQALRAVRFIAQHIKDADKDNEVGRLETRLHKKYLLPTFIEHNKDQSRLRQCLHFVFAFAFVFRFEFLFLFSLLFILPYFWRLPQELLGPCPFPVRSYYCLLPETSA